MKITLERDEAELPRDKSTPFHMGALSLVLGEDCDHFPFHWTELETKVSVSQLHFPPFHPDLGWLSDWWAIWGNWQVLKGAAEGTGFSTGTALWVACVPWALLMLPHRRTHPSFPLTSYSMRQMKFVFSLITAHLDMPLKIRVSKQNTHKWQKISGVSICSLLLWDVPVVHVPHGSTWEAAFWYLHREWFK